MQMLKTSAYITAVLLAGALTALLVTALQAAAPTVEAWQMPDGVRVIRDVEYARVNGQPLLVDIVMPPEKFSEPRPVVIFIHGGAWRAGDRRGGMRYLLPLARAGYTGFSIDYRLTNRARFPAQLHDCKAGVRWVRAHAAEYGAAPDWIGITGTSAGAHLAALVALSGGEPATEGDVGDCLDTSSKVQALVDWFGPTDLRYLGEDPDGWQKAILHELLGGLPSEVPELAALASPITHIDAGDPPVLIIHGDADKTVPVELSRVFHEALADADVEVEYIEVERGGHAKFRNTKPDQEDLVRLMIEFFDRKRLHWASGYH